MPARVSATIRSSFTTNTGKGQPCLQVPIQSPSLTAITSLQVDLEAAGYGSPRSRRNGYNPDADRVSPESLTQGLSVAVGKQPLPIKRSRHASHCTNGVEHDWPMVSYHRRRQPVLIEPMQAVLHQTGIWRERGILGAPSLSAARTRRHVAISSGTGHLQVLGGLRTWICKVQGRGSPNVDIAADVPELAEGRENNKRRPISLTARINHSGSLSSGCYKRGHTPAMSRLRCGRDAIVVTFQPSTRTQLSRNESAGVNSTFGIRWH